MSMNVFNFPTQVELEVTLDGEGKDRVFRVTIKWAAQVRVELLHLVLLNILLY